MSEEEHLWRQIFCITYDLFPNAQDIERTEHGIMVVGFCASLTELSQRQVLWLYKIKGLDNLKVLQTIPVLLVSPRMRVLGI